MLVFFFIRFLIDVVEVVASTLRGDLFRAAIYASRGYMLISVS